VKVWIAGSNGQLGQELSRTAPATAELYLTGSADCDVGDREAVAACAARIRPDLIVNAAAYTAVDKAESEPARAHAVNALGPMHLADVAGDARLIHISTDFVFDGLQGRACQVTDAPAPLSVYGRTKLAGEAPVLALAARGLVLRTSWVYSRFGNNFVKTMLRLMRSRPELRVVADQIAAPTWAGGLARTVWRCAAMPQIAGMHHWRDAGCASWYDFAVAIEEEARAAGLLTTPVQVRPITAAEYPTPARRPGFSLLDCNHTWAALGETPAHWRVSLRNMLSELEGQDV
jgi:dTDP-4-dehydrorhamnose reductase